MLSKDEVIEISMELRKSKDQLKKEVLMKKYPKKRDAVILPKQLFEVGNKEYLGDKWLCNGFILRVKKSLIVVDPGVNFYSRFVSSGLGLGQIKAMILSHKHLDHSNDFLVMLEMICKYRNTDLEIFIPEDFYLDLPKYFKKLIQDKKIQTKLLKSKTHEFNFSFIDDTKVGFTRLYHSTEHTYGFKIKTGDKKISYLSDSGYSVLVKTNGGEYKPNKVVGQFESIVKKHNYLKKFYTDSDLLIANINDLHFNRHSLYHMSGYDLLDLLQTSKIKKLILQHLSVLDAHGEDSNYIYKSFFEGQKYDVIVPNGQLKEILI